MKKRGLQTDPKIAAAMLAGLAADSARQANPKQSTASSVPGAILYRPRFKVQMDPIYQNRIESKECQDTIGRML
mgnify:CR=1 FL=1